MGALERREMTDVFQQGQRGGREELVDPVGPGAGNNGSCDGHSTVVGTAIRWSGSGTCSASEVATAPAPARYQAIEAVNAPGTP